MAFIWRAGRGRREWLGHWHCEHCDHHWSDVGWGSTPELHLEQLPAMWQHIPRKTCTQCSATVHVSMLEYDWDEPFQLTVSAAGVLLNGVPVPDESWLAQRVGRPYLLSYDGDGMPWGPAMWLLDTMERAYAVTGFEQAYILACPGFDWWPAGGAVCIDAQFPIPAAYEIDDVVSAALIWRCTLPEAVQALQERDVEVEHALGSADQIEQLERLWEQ
jgi:hypothetical protein